MVLARYFLTRFFKNVFVIAIGLTFLYNLIEFFEKMVRIKDTDLLTIAYFIGLNCIPSFFENLPIASWLGSCMTIKEMLQQNEWESLKILNINDRKIYSLVIIAGILLSTTSFFGKEFLAQNITRSAQIFKQEKFKKNQTKNLFNEWFSLKALPSTKGENKKNLFCHFDHLNVETKKGFRFSMTELCNDFSIKKIIFSNHFSIDPKLKNIHLCDIVELERNNKNTFSQKKEKIIYQPSFFSQLETEKNTPSLNKFFRIVTFGKNVLPTHVYQKLLYEFLNKILIHLLLLLYPLLTFALFFFFNTTISRLLRFYHKNNFFLWTLLLLPYPLATVLFTITDSLYQNYQFGLLAIIPYIFLFALTASAYCAIRII